MGRDTAADRAYEKIKRKILLLEAEPGEVLSESDLMEELGLGRSPIRDALRRLEQEDLVVILPRQGTLVSNISLADFHDVFELRMELEGFAAYLAALRAKPIHLAQLEELLQNAEQQHQDGNVEFDLGIDSQFHRIVREASGNRQLSKTLEILFNHSVRLFNLSRTRSATAAEEIPDYRAILDCFREKDAEKARQWMREHIRSSQERIRASFA